MNFLITRKLGDIISQDNPFDFLDDGPVNGAEIMLSRPELIDMTDIHDIKRKTQDLSLTAHLPFYDLNLASVDPFLRDYSMKVMIKGLEFCSDLEIGIAVAHLGLNVKLAGKAAFKWKEKFFDQKRVLESFAMKNGIAIVWENTYEETFEIFDEILRDNPKTLFCLDAGHCNCFADFSAVEFIERFHRNTVHMHFHDNSGDEDSHKAPGEGNINFSEILKRAASSAITNIVLEIEPEDFLKNKMKIAELLKPEEK